MDIYFKCECGRQQCFAESDRPGGVTQAEAEFIGWVKIDGKWVCPICNPALHQVKLEVFVQNRSGNRVSAGKYEASTENYTLLVDVQNLDLSDLLSIQIVFSGKVRP